MTVPRYVPLGLARQALEVAVPPGPNTLIWLVAIPVTLPLKDFALTVPPAGLPPTVMSPAAWTKAGMTPVPKATSKVALDDDVPALTAVAGRRGVGLDRAAEHRDRAVLGDGGDVAAVPVLQEHVGVHRVGRVSVVVVHQRQHRRRRVAPDRDRAVGQDVDPRKALRAARRPNVGVDLPLCVPVLSISSVVPAQISTHATESPACPADSRYRHWRTAAHAPDRWTPRARGSGRHTPAGAPGRRRDPCPC